MSTQHALEQVLRDTMMLSGNKLGDHAYPTEITGIAEDVIEFFQTYTRKWLPMDIAPRDRAILIRHDETLADRTDHPFHVHKGLSSPPTGTFIAIWVGEGYDWWFERDSSFGQPLMPAEWMPLPT